MSKRDARSWKLLIGSMTVMVSSVIVILNVGASADVGGSGPIPQAMQSASPSGQSSSPPNTCEPGPPVPPPVCVPGEESSAPPSSSPSASPSTSPEPGGNTHSAKISITYSNRQDAFKGKVDSKAVCQKARRVDLFEVAPGKDQNLGHALTNNKGKYRIPYPNANGRFYTKARKFTPERNTTCKGATSKRISV